MQLNNPRKKYIIIVAVVIHSNILWRWTRAWDLFTIWCLYSSLLAEVETNNLASISRLCLQSKHLNMLCRWAKSNRFWWVITRLKLACYDKICSVYGVCFWGDEKLWYSLLLNNESVGVCPEKGHEDGQRTGTHLLWRRIGGTGLV